MPAVQQNTETRRCIGYTTCARSPGNVRRVVTAKTQYSLTNAKDYFAEHLCVGDYYEEGQRVSGRWFGLGAETGETLTQRLKRTRTEQGQVAANRRIFNDFTFSPPKWASLAAFLGNDERILAAHTRAVRSALSEFEAFAATRIRTGGAQNDRSTGNFSAALFTHEKSSGLLEIEWVVFRGGHEFGARPRDGF